MIDKYQYVRTQLWFNFITYENIDESLRKRFAEHWWRVTDFTMVLDSILNGYPLDYEFPSIEGIK